MDPLVIRILEILLVPYFNTEVLWSIAPLFFALVMIQMYFGKYKTELLGWNTAFGNTISLMWVTAILTKYLHDTYGLINAWDTLNLRGYFILIFGLGLLTLVLAILDFNHAIPKKWAFILSSALPTNGLAYFILAIVLGNIPIDWITLEASIIIFIFLVIVFHLYKKIITPAKSILPTLKKRQELQKKKIRHLKHRIKKLIQPIIPNKEIFIQISDKKGKK
ncbi:MAG: hypothetical protein ABIJ08_04895 [Nanoarchaeota archaeon]